MAISVSSTKVSTAKRAPSKHLSEKPLVEKEKKDFWQAFKEVNLEISFGQKISSKDVMFFTTQLSLMLKTGIPINTGILTISNQVKKPVFKTLLLNLVDHIENGQSLFDAMSRHSEVFPQIYVSMIRAGELSGNLNEMLDRLVSFQKKREGIFSELRSALAYPIFLVVLSTSVIIFILTVVFPKFGDLFGELGDQIPMTTKMLLSLSQLLTNYAAVIVVTLGLVIGIAVKFFKTPKGKATLDAMFTSIPLLKGFILEFHISQLMRTLGTLISGGVPILEALQICKDMVGSPRFTRFMTTLIEGVARGEGLAKPIWTTSFLPQMVKEMIKTGEETGSLPEAMRHIADYYDETLEKGLKTFSTILEPLLLVVMGLVVGLVVISLMMPIFKLTQTLH